MSNKRVWRQKDMRLVYSDLYRRSRKSVREKEREREAEKTDRAT